ncbi:hypothetical protein CCP2SC5_330030 [Azospirillaceae bacterium]
MEIRVESLKEHSAESAYLSDSQVVETTAIVGLGCKENAQNVKEIFQMYEAVGFLYPQKKQLLGDYLSFIEANWSRAMDQGLLSIITFKGQDNNVEASIVGWRTVGGGNLPVLGCES